MDLHLAIYLAGVKHLLDRAISLAKPAVVVDKHKLLLTLGRFFLLHYAYCGLGIDFIWLEPLPLGQLLCN